MMKFNTLELLCIHGVILERTRKIVKERNEEVNNEVIKRKDRVLIMFNTIIEKLEKEIFKRTGVKI